MVQNGRYTKWYEEYKSKFRVEILGGKVSKAIQFSRTAKKSLCYENQAFATVALSSVVTKRD